MVKPTSTASMIGQIVINPTLCGLVIISETPIDIRGVHSGKAQDNSSTSTVLPTTPDGKEKKSNINHVKPVSFLAHKWKFTGAFPQFWDSI